VRTLLLAGGLGTRLRPLTDSVPKCLVRIHGKPLLEYWLDLLLPHVDAVDVVDAVLVNTHYLPEPVRLFTAASPWKSRISLVHEEILLGTGGTVLRNRDFFANQPFMVAHADNLTRFDVSGFIRRHRERPQGAAITMMTFETDDPRSCGIVEEDPRGMVKAFHEKVSDPPGNHANAAVYIFEPSVIDYLATLGKDVIDLSTEVIPRYVGRICTFHNADYHRDIGTLDSLAKAEREFSPGGASLHARNPPAAAT
jgi:mannose-1-phosphate guanylyltransferase